MILTLNYHKISLLENIPPGFEQYHIPGTAFFSWMGTAGYVFLQQVILGPAQLRYFIVMLGKENRLEINIPASEPNLIMSLGGNWSFFNENKQEVPVKENQYNLVVQPQIRIVHVSPAAEPNQLILVAYSIKHLTVSHPFSFLPAHCINQLHAQLPFTLYSPSPFAGPAILEQVIQVIQTSYYPHPRKFQEEVIRRLMFAVSENANQLTDGRNRFLAGETDTIQAVRQLIDTDLSHHYTIEELARFSGMNRDKLTMGFKSMFGKGMYAYFLERRLLHARHLLENTPKPLKEIAGIAGYRSASNFSIACKKFFGVTPGEIRTAARL